MKVTIFYTVPQIKEMEITEDMIRDLCNRFRSGDQVLEALDWYIQKESGYVEDDGRDFEYYQDENDIKDWVREIIKKIKEEEK